MIMLDLPPIEPFILRQHLHHHSYRIPTAFIIPQTIHDPSCKFKITLHHHVRRKILPLNSPIDFVPNELDDCRILYYRRCHVLPHCRSLAYFTTRNGEILATYTLYCTPEVIICPGSIMEVH